MIQEIPSLDLAKLTVNLTRLLLFVAILPSNEKQEKLSGIEHFLEHEMGMQNLFFKLIGSEVVSKLPTPNTDPLEITKRRILAIVQVIAGIPHLYDHIYYILTTYTFMTHLPPCRDSRRKTEKETES